MAAPRGAGRPGRRSALTRRLPGTEGRRRDSGGRGTLLRPAAGGAAQPPAGSVPAMAAATASQAAAKASGVKPAPEGSQSALPPASA